MPSVRGKSLIDERALEVFREHAIESSEVVGDEAMRNEGVVRCCVGEQNRPASFEPQEVGEPAGAERIVAAFWRATRV